MTRVGDVPVEDLLNWVHLSGTLFSRRFRVPRSMREDVYAEACYLLLLEVPWFNGERGLRNFLVQRTLWRLADWWRSSHGRQGSRRALMGHPRSLDQPIGPEGGTLGDLVEDRRLDSFRGVEDQDFLLTILRGLPKTDRDIIILYYYQGLNQKEVGDILLLSRARVCQRLHSTLDRIRQRLRGEGLSGETSS